MSTERRPMLGSSGPSPGARRAVAVPAESGSFPALLSFTGSDLSSWLAERREEIDALITKTGAVLIKRTPIAAPSAFGDAMRALYGELIGYHERSSPRREVGDHIYTSTEYPADRAIPLHNENSYQVTWPLRIAFCCLTPATSGGATPLADCREVLAHIDPAIVDTFRRRGIRYVRNFRSQIGLDWQTAFGTADPQAVDAYCQTAALACTWHDADWLQVAGCRGALARHPTTHELLWFNHAAFFHASTLDPSGRDGLATLAPDELPNTVEYGDGTAIPLEVVQHVRSAYERATRKRSWAAGDLLLLDNMLVAHGREPFTGLRQVLVAMARPCGERGL